MTSGRALSGVERIWLTADRLAPPFVNQLVLEAPTGDLGAVDWSAAVAAAAAAVPDLSVRLRGVLGWTRWAPGPPPRLVRIVGSDWDGASGGGAPFLARALDPRTGPVAELVVVEGSTPRLVLRTHHAVTDGQGTLAFARALVAAARGEPPIPVPPSATTDADLAAELGAIPETPPAADCPSPLGPAVDAPLGVRWVRARVDGAGRRLLPRAITALASRARADRAAVRIDVPVDLRRHRPSPPSTANLTGLVRLPVGRLLAETEPSEAVGSALRAALADTEEARFPLVPAVVRWLPLWLMERIARKGAIQALATGRFSTSGTVSNLGRLDLAALAVPGFTPHRAFFIPPGSPALPVFLTLTGDDEGVTLCASAPLALAANGRLEALMDDLVGRLAQGAPRDQSGHPVTRRGTP